MDLTHETISAIIQGAGLLNPLFKIGVNEHTPLNLIKDAKSKYITKWFVHAYILLNGGFLSITDLKTSEMYKKSLHNLANGLDILKYNHSKMYEALGNKHYWAEYADALIQCAIFGEVRYKWQAHT